jgi:glycosyltransferase involved in cell wall biosynthesis
MKPRIGFAIEQALGHVAYGLGLRRALERRTDLECVWIDVPFDESGFGRIPFVGRNWTVRGSTRAGLALAREHKARPFDALFLHTQTIALFSAGHMSRIPTLLSLDATPKNYDSVAPAYRDRVHAPWLERAKLSAHRAVMRRARAFTTWSQWAKDSLVRDYGVDGADVTVIHPGTVLAAFGEPARRAPRPSGPLRVLFVGGDFVRKGGDLLMDVARSFPNGSLELHLVTGADVAPERDVHVHRGLKPYAPELMRLFTESDVFVLPTRGDCLAMVLGEAMASSLPIITTDVGAHAEAVEDGASGFVIGVDDGAALKDRLGRLVKDRDLASRMGRRAREIGEARFNMEANADRIAEILLGLARR